MSSMIEKKVLLVRQNSVTTDSEEEKTAQILNSLKNSGLPQNINENELGILSRFFQSLDKNSLSAKPSPGSQPACNDSEPNSRHIQLTKGELMMIREHLRL